ncbi:MAG: hypothetical protein ACMG6E_00160 [Candidatus Roizmanbacteria bacterium]
MLRKDTVKSMTDSFYSFGDAVAREHEEANRAAEREKLRRDAERHALHDDPSIPVPITILAPRTGRVYLTATGASSRTCSAPIQGNASTNPYVAQKQREELDALVAKRAQEKKRVEIRVVQNNRQK